MESLLNEWTCYRMEGVAIEWVESLSDGWGHYQMSGVTTYMLREIMMMITYDPVLLFLPLVSFLSLPVI